MVPMLIPCEVAAGAASVWVVVAIDSMVTVLIGIDIDIDIDISILPVL
jgi:hypothetical protein